MTELKGHKIKFIKSIRVQINALVEKLKNSESKGFSTRSTSLSITKLQEARMWLGQALNELGDTTPYVHADNPSTAEISPEADV